MYLLKVFVISKDGNEPLLERVIEISDYTSCISESNNIRLVDVRFESLVETLDLLFVSVPHVININLVRL